MKFYSSLSLLIFLPFILSSCGEAEMQESRAGLSDSKMPAGRAVLGENNTFLVDLEGPQNLSLTGNALDIKKIEGQFSGPGCADQGWSLTGASGLVYGPIGCDSISYSNVKVSVGGAPESTLLFNTADSQIVVDDGRIMKFAESTSGIPMVASDFNKPPKARSIILNSRTDRALKIDVQDDGLPVCNSQYPIKIGLNEKDRLVKIGFNSPNGGFPAGVIIAAGPGLPGIAAPAVDQSKKEILFDLSKLKSGSYTFPGPYSISLGGSTCKVDNFGIVLNLSEVSP